MRDQKGITLIALAVTIIITLILAITSVVMIVSDNGVVNRSENYAQNVEERSDLANEELNNMLNNLNSIMNPAESTVLKVEKDGKEKWKDRKVTLKLKATKGNYTIKGYTIQYQKNSNTGDWIEYTEPIINLEHNDTVWTRLLKNDEIVKNTLSSIKIIDGMAPEDASISISSNGRKSINAKIVLNDNETGIDISKCKWVYNTTNSMIGTNESSYTNSFTNTEETITLDITKERYYLHVLSVDNVGNKRETIEGPILKGPISGKIEDSNGNTIVIPNGFDLADDSGDTVEEGIVIEDSEGNQYVWVPVSNIDGSNTNPIKKSDGTEVVITLGRYGFKRVKNSTTNEYEDGTPSLIQSGADYLKTTAENVADGTVDTKYRSGSFFYELSDSRISNGLYDSTSTNTTAKNLKDFITKVKNNGGFYIARYEAGITGTVDNNQLAKKTLTDGSVKPQSKKGLGVWNYVTQVAAARIARSAYTDNNSLEADLINSYAWDTTLLYIRTMQQSNYPNAGRGTNTTLKTTGATGDEVCKIFDMACNVCEWTTEYSTKSSSPCVCRGGYYNDTYYYASFRLSDSIRYPHDFVGFRVILYL